MAGLSRKRRPGSDAGPHVANIPSGRRFETMTKSELIEILTLRQGHLKADDVDMAVKSLLEMMGGALAHGERIEIRGFGSFSLHYRPPRTGRNPKTGDAVALPGKHVPHFKPGKELRERVADAMPLAAED
jgi:integration host factor, beta subunit